MTSSPRSHPKTIYWIALFMALHIALPLYITSSFLAQFVEEQTVGLLFSASAVLGLFLLVWAPTLLPRIGNYHSLSLVVILELLALASVVLAQNPLIVSTSFVVAFSLHWLLLYYLDIFLEDGSRDATTGSTRGIYLTTMSAGVLVAPAITGVIATSLDFRAVYAFSAFALFAMYVMLYARFRRFRDPVYKMLRFRKALATTIAHPELWRIAVTNFLLFLFYSWMVVYLPVYLTARIGFSWQEIGVLFAIMLSPFVLFEWPLGRLADRRFGEKELLAAGFAIAAFATTAIFFVTTPHFALWAAVLFLSRVGASMIEIMNETYFFKHVASADASLVGLFRMSRPLGFAVGPAIAALFLTFFDVPHLFLVLGVILLIGVPLAWGLQDTK
jgi:MFS family permease